KRVLGWKAAVLARQTEDRLLRDQPELADLLGQLRIIHAGLARVSAQTPTPAGQKQWLERFRSLEQEKEKLEVRLTGASAGYRTRHQLEPDAIAAALPAGSALIDLLVYQHARPDPDREGQWLGQDRLAAFVLRKGVKAQRLELGPAAPIEDAVEAWRKS